jgi:hypothetical protein
VIEDAASIVKIHKNSGVAGLLTRLDSTLLKKCFYEPFISLPGTHHLLITSERSGEKPVGYLGYRENAHFNSFNLPKVNFTILLNLARIFLKEPKVILLTLNVWISEKKARKILGKLCSNYNEVQIMVIERQNHKAGLGTQLMKYMLSLHPKKDIVVRTQDSNNIEFYSRFGFKLVYHSRILNSNLYVLLRKVSA